MVMIKQTYYEAKSYADRGDLPEPFCLEYRIETKSAPKELWLPAKDEQ